MWPARAAATPVSTGALGSLRLLTQSKKFSHVRDGAVADAVRADCGILSFFHVLAVDVEAAAVNFQCRLGAAKFEASVVDGGIHHAFINDIEAGIAEGGLNRIGAIPLIEKIFVAEHEGLLRLVGFHRPVDNVDPVREQISHSSAAEVPEPAPVGELYIAKRLVGRVAEPHLPVECLLVDRFQRAIVVIVLPPVRPHLNDAAETAGLDEIDGVAKVDPTALLHAALQNLLARADGFGQDGTFFQSVRDRLFQIDVFACGERVKRHAHMPVVGRGDDHRVNVFRQYLVIVEMRGRQAVGTLHDRIARGTVDITHGDDFIRGANFVGGVEKAFHAVSGADDADAKFVAGAPDASGCERGHTAGDDETAAIDHVG